MHYPPDFYTATHEDRTLRLRATARPRRVRVTSDAPVTRRPAVRLLHRRTPAQA
jgi:hypothetical protein